MMTRTTGQADPAQLRVLDVMCGSGGRGARYLAQASATEVWSNDFDPRNLPTIAFNLAVATGLSGARSSGSSSSGSSSSGSSDLPATSATTTAEDVEAAGRAALARAATWHVPGLLAPVHEWRSSCDGGAVARATCADAARLLSALGLRAGAAAAAATNGDASASSPPPAPSALFDLVDLDSFGSADTHLVALALGVVAYGGLLYLTSTDGFVSAGKRPERGLAAYGAYTRPFASGAPEQGLRALIGNAARLAAAQGLTVEPLFGYYSFHGPVFRAMLRVTRGGNGREGRGRGGEEGGEDGSSPAAAARQRAHARRGFDSGLYGFVGHCREHGETGSVPWADLGRAPAAAFCPACARGGASGGSASAADLAGPMWLGPLHDGAFVDAMTAEAERRGWCLLPEEAGEKRGRRRRQAAAAGDDDAGGGAEGARVRAAERDARLFYTGRASRTNPQLPLAELLAVMREEADARLPPLYVTSEALGRRLARCPPRDGLIAALRARGWAASRCQLERRALRTDAPMEEVVRVAAEAFEGCGAR